jgi:hypothetical protein
VINLSNLLNKAVKESVDEFLKDNKNFLFEDEEFKRKEMENSIKQRYKSSKKNEEELNTKKESDDNKESDEKNSKEDDIIGTKKIVKDYQNLRSEKEKLEKSSNSSDSEEESGNDLPPKIELPSEKEMSFPTYEFTKEQINSFRAGGSLNDENIDQNFKKYFDSLTEPEKKSFMVFSTALAQIARGLMNPADVIRQKDIEKNKIEKKQTQNNKKDDSDNSGIVIKNNQQSNDSMPIVIGENLEVRNIIRKLYTNKR